MEYIKQFGFRISSFLYYISQFFLILLFFFYHYRGLYFAIHQDNFFSPRFTSDPLSFKNNICDEVDLATLIIFNLCFIWKLKAVWSAVMLFSGSVKIFMQFIQAFSSVMTLFVVSALLYLRWSQPQLKRPYKVCYL